MKIIREKLLNLVDEEYLKFHTKLCPDTKKTILGIRMPELRKMAKEIAKDEKWRECIKELEEEYFEETVLKGFIIAYAKEPLKDKIVDIQKFIPEIDSWSITDTFVPTLKIKKSEKEFFWNFIIPYTKSKKEFEVRFSIICMLDYYIDEENVDTVIEILDKIEHEGYYVKMAIAWTLAEIGIKFNDKAMVYLKSENNLDKFTYNKTLQKMIESYRINLEQKDILRKMKRK